MKTTGDADTDRYGFALVSFDAKRRAVMPAALYAHLGLREGEAAIVRADGPGRVVFESPSASIEAARDRLLNFLGNPPAGDAAAEMRAERDHDIELSEAAFARRSRSDTDPALTAQRGRDLLAALGLD